MTRIEWCRDACAKARWTSDEVFGGGQHNCPHHFGVTHCAAVVNGRVNCEHFKRKESK